VLGNSINMLLWFLDFSFLYIQSLLKTDLHIFSMCGRTGRRGACLTMPSINHFLPPHPTCLQLPLS
uniref:Uncharacterized protein n=1 Tax=Sciurus vulgaris TaxID=55149 RepID=A0A8D2CJW7_SCIVU